ncbi:MAG: hypothetical protein VB934_07265 [Polyangiaceae bacterium]
MISRIFRPSNLAPSSLALIVFVLAVVGVGCPCLRGPVNASPALRWWLFSTFGASKICPELMKRGIGLKVQDQGPSVGRFYPASCRIEVNSEFQVVTVHFQGSGYAFTPVSKRVGFTCSASVQYRPDFFMAPDAVYVWGKVNRIVSGPTFKLGYVEDPLAGAAAAVTPLGIVANSFGNQIAAGELTRGFTVVQDYDTESNSFALGVVKPPHKPRTPYDVAGSERHTFGNETIEVHYNQRDFLGPFEVVEDGQAITMKYFVQGPAVDAMVVTRAVGEVWRQSYQQGQRLGPPPGPVVAGAPLAGGRESLASYRLPPGQYYVVIDNTAYAGTVAPRAIPLDPLGGQTARISYLAQLAEE